VRRGGLESNRRHGAGILAAFTNSTVLVILSEIGVDMSKWRNEKAFAAWLGLWPNQKISGGGGFWGGLFFSFSLF